MAGAAGSGPDRGVVKTPLASASACAGVGIVTERVLGWDILRGLCALSVMVVRVLTLASWRLPVLALLVVVQ